MRPKLFLAIYECTTCREEYEMENCYIPKVNFPCEYCEEQRVFVAKEMIHRSWEWDSVVTD